MYRLTPPNKSGKGSDHGALPRINKIDLPEVDLDKQTKRWEFHAFLFSFIKEINVLTAQALMQTRNLCGMNYDLRDYSTENCVELLHGNIEMVSRSRDNWKVITSIIRDIEFNHNHYLSVLSSDLKRYKRKTSLEI